jgi:hypothetical protein
MNRWHGLDPRRVVVAAWCGLLALAVGAPLLRPGFVLSYDMVWVPHLDLDRAELWGLGSGLPRAVPSDAVVALLGAGLPAALVQRLLLLGALFVLALGAARLMRARPLAAQLATATFALWNPFVAERLVLGQWPLLIALAGFPWLVSALTDPGGARTSTLVLALAATAFSPAAGVMGLVLVLCVGWRHGPVRLVLLAGLVNAPWIVAGLLHVTISRSDPAAVALFDVQPEGFFGRVGSALTLGGIWNTEVVPTSRTLLLVGLVSIVMGAVMLLGCVTMWRDGRRLLLGLLAPAVLGLAFALSGWLAPEVVARVVTDVPAGGLVRDGTRWLALAVPFQAVVWGAGIGTLVERARWTAWSYPSVVLALVLPIAALPDLAWGVGGRLEPATYPASWSSARDQIERSDAPGDILVLPFSAYRRPAWNHDRPVLDPAGRFFDRTTVTNDELVVSGRTIAGEDPRAAAVGRVLRSSPDVPAGLARRGIRFVVVQTDAPGADSDLLRLDGAREIRVAGPGLRVFRLQGVRTTRVDAGDRTVMAVTWTVSGLTILLALVAVARRGVGRLHRKPAEHRPRQVPEA